MAEKERTALDVASGGVAAAIEDGKRELLQGEQIPQSENSMTAGQMSIRSFLGEGEAHAIHAAHDKTGSDDVRAYLEKLRNKVFLIFTQAMELQLAFTESGGGNRGEQH